MINVINLFQKKPVSHEQLKVYCIHNIEAFHKGQKIWEHRVKNLVPNEFKDYMLDVAVKNATQETNFYVGLSGSNYTPLATNTYATPGFTEFTDYDETTRPAWTTAAVSSQTLTNVANKATFTMSTGVDTTLYLSFVVAGVNTKGDTAGAGMLVSSASWGTGRPYVATDVIQLTIAMTQG